MYPWALLPVSNILAGQRFLFLEHEMTSQSPVASIMAGGRSVQMRPVCGEQIR